MKNKIGLIYRSKRVGEEHHHGRGMTGVLLRTMQNICKV